MHEYWQSKELYQNLFGKNVKMDSYSVKNLKSILQSLPKQNSYDIITYGSLMNEDDSKRSLPNQLDRFNCALKGYERIFNVGYVEYGSYLNIKQSTSKTPLYCVGIEISFKDLPSYILREGLYDIVPIEYNLFNDKTGNVDDEVLFPGFTVISNTIYDGIEPLLNYFHLCLTGIKNEMGIEGINNFLTTTQCYSVKQHKYIYANEWLEELDLTDYMIRHMYSPR